MKILILGLLVASGCAILAYVFMCQPSNLLLMVAGFFALLAAIWFYWFYFRNPTPQHPQADGPHEKFVGNFELAAAQLFIATYQGECRMVSAFDETTGEILENSSLHGILLSKEAYEKYKKTTASN